MVKTINKGKMENRKNILIGHTFLIRLIIMIMKLINKEKMENRKNILIC